MRIPLVGELGEGLVQQGDEVDVFHDPVGGHQDPKVGVGDHIAEFLGLVPRVDRNGPGTEQLAQSLQAKVFDALVAIWDNFLDFLPNLVTVFIIIIIARLVMKLLRYFRNGLQQGKIKFSSIHLR